MKRERGCTRPILARHARYRWDKIRQQHQLVYPEGVLVLNETAAAVVQLCDGRPISEVIGTLNARFESADTAADVVELVERLASKGLLRDAGET